MKKQIISLFALLLSFSMSSPAQKTYALVMGIQKYDNPSFHQNPLKNTAKDARDVKKVLSKSGCEVSLLTGKYVNKENVNYKLSQMVSLVNNRPNKDNIIIFFSGHGGDGIMCMWDGKYSYMELFNRLRNAKARNIFIFLDACLSGSCGQIMTQMSDINPRISVISATRPDETSIDDPFQVIVHGWYSQGLIKGLRGMGDKNEDRKITLMELYRYLYNDVTSRSNHYEDISMGMISSFHPQLYGPISMHESVVVEWKK